MNLYQPIISGSLEVSGSVTINGTLRVLSGSILGTASIAENSLLLGGLNSGSFQSTSSFSSFSGSLSTRLVTDEANIATNTAASASFAAQSASLSTRLTTDESNFTSLSSSFATTSGSISGRVTLIEGQYATTGSNNFTKPQQISDVSNAISFTSTASLYTNGGLRVSKDSYVSGTAYFNNVVVYGTSSIQYITSSQVNFGTNIITVNTDTPAVRFGGLAVFDSGSTQLTGSMLWDSEKNNWIYSNPSGSTYSGGMIISGPRNTGSLGNEQGTTSCALMMGQGGDHITSSAIFSYGNATCFYGTTVINNSGAASFASCLSTGGSFYSYIAGQTALRTYTKAANVEISSYQSDNGSPFTKTTDIVANADSGVASQMRLLTAAAGGNPTTALTIASSGASIFASQVCAPTVVASTCLAVRAGSATLVANNIAGAASNNHFAMQRNDAQYASIGLNGSDNFTIFGTSTSCPRLTIDGSGLIGIGTTTPARTLEVCGNNTPPLRLTNSGGNVGIEFITGGGYYNWRAGSQLAIGNSFEITPSTAAGGTTFTTPALLVTSGGNVGIGCTSPGDVLTVGGNATISTAGNTTLKVNGTSGVPGLALSNSSSTDYIYGGVGSVSNIAIAPGDVYAMRVYAAGCVVCIGGTVCTPRLNINTSLTTPLSVASPGYSNAALSYAGASSASGYSTLRARVDGTYGWELDHFGSTYPTSDYGVPNGTALINILNGPMILGTNNNSKFIICANGNINMCCSLYVSSTITASGRIQGSSFTTGTCTFAATSAGTNYDITGPGSGRWLASVNTNAVYHWNGVLALTFFDSADFGVNILTCGSYATAASVSIVNSGSSLRFCFSQNVGNVTVNYLAF